MSSLCLMPDDLRSALEKYHSDNYLVLDFETTKFPRALSRMPESKLCLSCWKYKGVMKHSFKDEHEQSELVSDVQEADFVVAHNWKFEAGWLKRMGVDLKKVVPWDTMLAEWVLNAGVQAPNGYYTLHESAIRRGHKGKLDLVEALWEAGLDTPDISARILLAYCIRDVEACEHIFLQQRKLLGEEI